MSKKLKKNEHLKYEELSDAESAALSGGAQDTFTDGNPFNGPFGQEKKRENGPPDRVIKGKTTGS